MSKKSTPGDGGHGLGAKGLPFGEAKRSPLSVVRAIRELLTARQR
ncbi:hypothetical protein ACE1OC_42665 (plasmid) [Streptomyces sp. DSM 116496]